MSATRAGLPTARGSSVSSGLWGCPTFGQVGFAERVIGESFLAYRVAEAFVQDTSAAGKVLGVGGCAAQPGGQDVEDVADDRGVLEGAY